MEMRKGENEFSAPGQNRKGRNLSDTEQAARQEVDSIDSNDGHVRGLLHQRARDRAISLRWNVNALMFVYAILITVIILTMQGVNSLIVASVAVLGLVMIWLFSSLQVRKLEKQFYQQETHDYMELLSSEPRNNFNEEALGSVSSTKSPLTQRELEILIQMAGGKINKQIAYALGISEMTVKNHISHIFWKLDVDGRTSAVLSALRHGWIKYDHLKQSNPKSITSWRF
jgi:DNA-binding CsgD family transcriptional regulator